MSNCKTFFVQTISAAGPLFPNRAQHTTDIIYDLVCRKNQTSAQKPQRTKNVWPAQRTPMMGISITSLIMLNIYTQTLSVHANTHQHVSIMKHHKTSLLGFSAHPHVFDDTVLCYKYHSSDHLCLVVRASVMLSVWLLSCKKKSCVGWLTESDLDGGRWCFCVGNWEKKKRTGEIRLIITCVKSQNKFYVSY